MGAVSFAQMFSTETSLGAVVILPFKIPCMSSSVLSRFRQVHFPTKGLQLLLVMHKLADHGKKMAWKYSHKKFGSNIHTNTL